MSQVQDLEPCPQCGFASATYIYDCRTCYFELSCPRCGYFESDDPESSQYNRRGAGALLYHPVGAIAYAVTGLGTAEEVAEAEAWLRGELAAKTVEPEAYLTRWNEQTGTIENAVGEFADMEQIEAKRALRLEREIHAMGGAEQLDYIRAHADERSTLVDLKMHTQFDTVRQAAETALEADDERAIQEMREAKQLEDHKG